MFSTLAIDSPSIKRIEARSKSRGMLSPLSVTGYKLLLSAGVRVVGDQLELTCLKAQYAGQIMCIIILQPQTLLLYDMVSVK